LLDWNYKRPSHQSLPITLRSWRNGIRDKGEMRCAEHSSKVDERLTCSSKSSSNRPYPSLSSFRFNPSPSISTSGDSEFGPAPGTSTSTVLCVSHSTVRTFWSCARACRISTRPLELKDAKTYVAWYQIDQFPSK